MVSTRILRQVEPSGPALDPVLTQPKENMHTTDSQEAPLATPKKKVVRCDQTCTYVSGGKEPRRCNNKCAREPGHILNCKCRAHEMQ